MTATFAPSPWPKPASPNTALRHEAGWRFAHELASGAGLHFDLRRNVSLTPRQLVLAYGLVCALSLAVAAGFWWNGVRVVGLFTGLELLAVGVAMVVVARHAADRESVTVIGTDSGRELAVEQHVGPVVERIAFRAEWVRVEPAAGVGSLVELSGQGRSICIGRHVRPELRAELADELRRALRQ